MSTERPEIITSENLSIAWGQAFLKLYDNTGPMHSPLVISVTDFEDQIPVENQPIRSAVDRALSDTEGKYVVKKTALTIFPNDLWEFRKYPNHEKFAALFREHWFPAVHRNNAHNRTGTYFQRLVAHGAEIQKHRLVDPYTDQLQKIIEFWSHKGSIRRSALQAAIFDPSKDHTMSALRPFPCLQQVSFSYDNEGGLAITGYYPSEYIFDRGYGNYLGLCHLGRYIARQLGLSLTRMNCVVNHPILFGGKTSKRKLSELTAIIRNEVKINDELKRK